MRKILLLVFIVIFSRSSVIAQPFVYNFDNTLDELLGSGPTLLEVSDATCPGAGPGSFSNAFITNTCSPATPTEPVYNFLNGGGVQFDNSGSLIGDTYTIHVYFKFNNINTGEYHRVLEFADGANDVGVYAFEDCLRFSPNPTGQVCPNFDATNFHLISLSRDGATDVVDLYVDGVFISSVPDPSQDYVPATATTNITLFRDNLTECQSVDGAIRLLVIDSNPSTAGDIASQFGFLCALVLPLKLVDFTAIKQNSAVALKWVTESEQNSSHFDVERSSDGKNFTKLNSVPATNRASRNIYNYTDLQPLAGTGFYRLKVVDNDGRFKYSSVLKISMSGLQKFEVFPNPTRESVTISGIQSNMKVRLLNIDGRQLVQKISTGQSMTLDLNNYPAGVYIITYDDGQTTLRQKIVKH